MSYSFVACFTFKTPGGQHFLAHEAGKKLVMSEYKAWEYYQSRKPIMEAAKKRRRAAIMREMGLDIDGKPLVEPTSASTEEQEQKQDQGEDQVADAGIKTEVVADARTSAEDQDQDQSADPRTSAEDQDQSADRMDVDQDPSADARTRIEADAGVKTEDGPRMKTEADARMSAEGEDHSADTVDEGEDHRADTVDEGEDHRADTVDEGEDHRADTVDEGEDLRADVGIKTEADAGTRADGQDQDRATDASTARGLKRIAEDELEDQDRRTTKRFKSEHVGGVFGMVFRAMVKGLAQGNSEVAGRPLKGAGRVRGKTGAAEARRYRMPTYILKTQVRPSWEGRRSMLEALRSVQFAVQPMTGRTLGMSSSVSQMTICV